MRRLSARIERWHTARPFVIARGAKTWVDVVTVAISDGEATGRGEGTPIYYRAETAGSVLAEVEAMAPMVARGIGRHDLRRAMSPGAGRNAIDAALLDLEAKRSGRRAWEMLGLPPPRPLVTAATISLDTPARMGADAARMGHAAILKLKLGGMPDDPARVAAVRQAAPDTLLIADANESWQHSDVKKLTHILHQHDVQLVEQPLPAGRDRLLGEIRPAVPIVADESFQALADLDTLPPGYSGINVKLDKCGGLTEALDIIAAARARGLLVMVGCMLGTSLGIAPAFLAAMLADHADLDGATHLAEDRAHGMTLDGSRLSAPEVALWG